MRGPWSLLSFWLSCSRKAIKWDENVRPDDRKDLRQRLLNLLKSLDLFSNPISMGINAVKTC